MTSLSSTLRLLRLGIAAELRSPALRIIGVVGALGAAAIASMQGVLAGSSAIYLTEWLSRVYGIIIALWFGYAANRDQNEQDGAVFRCKPIDGARWVVVAFGSGLGAWLALLALAFLGGALAQLPQAGTVSLAAYGWGYVRAALLVIGPATLSFTLSRMMRSPLGGIITVFGWFCALAGRQYIPLFVQPDYTQNRPLLLAVAALMFVICALLVERARRGELRRPMGAVIAVLALILAASGAAAHSYRVAPTPESLFGPDAALAPAISGQYLQDGEKVPGFWLPDGKGGIVRTAAYPGKILLIYLFPADDVDAGRTLPAMEAIQKEYGPRGVQVIGVCFSPDHGDGPALARTGGYHFPIGTDLSTVTTSPPYAPVLTAYNVQELPLLVVTDRRHKARNIAREPYYDVMSLRRMVELRLAAEPE
jgi:hypothetical protein